MLQSLKTRFFRITGADKLTPARRKNIGEFLLLGSSLMIVPLLFLRDPGIVVKVVLQLVWALMIAAGFLLTYNGKKQKQ